MNSHSSGASRGRVVGRISTVQRGLEIQRMNQPSHSGSLENFKVSVECPQFPPCHVFSCHKSAAFTYSELRKRLVSTPHRDALTARMAASRFVRCCAGRSTCRRPHCSHCWWLSSTNALCWPAKSGYGESC